MPDKKKTNKKKIDEKTAEKETVTKDKPEVGNNEVEVISEEGKTIIVKAKKGLSIGQFELLSQMLKSENEKTEYEIILMPYSVDTVDIK